MEAPAMVANTYLEGNPYSEVYPTSHKIYPG